MKKRIISLILVLVLSFTVASGAFAAGTGFKDVSEKDWYYSYVKELTDLKIFTGFDDGIFRPNGFITNGQALKLILMAAGYGEQTAPEGEHWAQGYLDKAYATGVVSTDEISLNTDITRIQVAELAAKALGIVPTIASPFVDTDSEYAVALYESGVISGVETKDGLKFNCNDKIKRSEMCKIISVMIHTDFSVYVPDVGGGIIIDDTTNETLETPIVDEVVKAEPKYLLVDCEGFLNIRTQPSTEADVAGKILSGRTAKRLQTLDGWYMVEYNGTVGYISADFCTLTDTEVVVDNSGVREEICEYALQFYGIRYVYGGMSPSGFDCSGYTLYVMKEFGYKLPHSARAQYTYGTPIEKSQLLPGDLVFFSNASTSGIGHVGIYVGEGNFIHASSGSAYSVTVTPLDKDYYLDHYKGACRIIQD